VSVYALERARVLRKAGEKLRRDGLSKRVIALTEEFIASDGSYKGAMTFAGRLKAIAQAAKFDNYWTEKVDDGFHRETEILQILSERASTTPTEDAG